jgi:hypothetical protein
MAYTSRQGDNYIVATGGQSIIALNPSANGINGGFIVNGFLQNDQAIASNPEPLYVNITGQPASLNANGSTFALQPGQPFPLVSNMTNAIYVNAATSGHAFTIVVW